jgi:putative oxygen-independent coproporphyrinogen III oxidase
MSWTEVDTLYFGGGTPSRLGGDGLASALEALREHLSLAPDAEVTVEANPEDVTESAARTWRSVGVNRLSIGAQSFDDRVLAWMRRSHTAETTHRAVEAARAAGFDNLSLDLIFAMPPELNREWGRDLDIALGLAPDHMSIYGLTFHSETPFGRWVGRGETNEAPEGTYIDEFQRADDVATAAGYEHYEVSNYARPGRRSRHNSSYWSGSAYAGLGPAAHEYDGARRRWNVAPYSEWRRRLAHGTDPLDEMETLTSENVLAERVYLELRTADGTVLKEGEAPALSRWQDMGWAEIADERLTLTPRGWLLLDGLAATLTDIRSR